MKDSRNKAMADLRRTPQQERSRRSLDAILDATAELLAETDPATLTMSAIGTRAGVSKAAIYRYYPDRPAVIRALAERYLGPIAERLTAKAEGASGADAVDALIDGYYELFLDEPVVRSIWVTGFSYPEIGEYCLEFDRNLAVAIVDAVCTEPTAEQFRRGHVLVRSLRAVVELALQAGEAEGRAMIDDFKSVVRSGA